MGHNQVHAAITRDVCGNHSDRVTERVKIMYLPFSIVVIIAVFFVLGVI